MKSFAAKKKENYCNDLEPNAQGQKKLCHIISSCCIDPIYSITKEKLL